MKTVLITGASGALGKAILTLFASNQSVDMQMANQARPASNWRVLAASRNASGDNNIKLDVCNREQTHTVINETRPDMILHLAATLDDNFDKSFAVNVDGARNICDAVRATGYPTRILLAGSAAEYGVVQPDENPISVNHELKPVSLYGLTKAWQSMLGLYYANAGLDIVIARIFNLDGRDVSERLFAGRVHAQIAAIKSGQRKRLAVGSLDAIRDYVPIAIAAKQILVIAKHGRPGLVYHVGSGEGISMRKLLQSYLEPEGLDFSIVDEDSSHSNRKGYDVPAIYADMTGTTTLLIAADRAEAKCTG